MPRLFSDAVKSSLGTRLALMRVPPLVYSGSARSRLPLVSAASSFKWPWLNDSTKK